MIDLLPNIEALAPTLQERIVAGYNRLKDYREKGPIQLIVDEKEKFADLLNQSGLHIESRERYYELLHAANSLVDKSRLLRKISMSHTAQREHLRAQIVAEEALSILRLVNKGDVDNLELFEALTACAYSNYFVAKAPRLKELVKEMRAYFPFITDNSVRLKFYFVVMLDILLRYQWYMLPEESITHGEFHLQLAIETKNWNSIGAAYNSLGFAHLWREEHDLARQNFGRALEFLQNRNFDMVLISQVYMAVSYRMQNNIPMTEKWAMTSMEVARKNENQLYIGLSYGNLSWVYAKRGNLLYAEDYATKGLALQQPYKSPMLWLCIFPLLECLHKKEKYDEAGMYCYLLLHPSLKLLPFTINEKLKLMNELWVDNMEEKMAYCLDDIINEAKFKNYF